MFCFLVNFILYNIVQCNTNPCELGGDFSAPNYQCFQATDNIDNVVCTCPDGNAQINRRCRKKFLTRCHVYYILVINHRHLRNG